MNKYNSGKKLKEELLKGSQHIFDFVSKTYGPNGESVIMMDSNNKPKVTKDGVSIAKVLDSSEPEQNIAVQTIKQASIETVENAGDGTTTAVILTHELFRESLSFIEKTDYPVNSLKRELDIASVKLSNAIVAEGVPIRSEHDLFAIAKTACNGDNEIARVVSKAIESTGKSGGILIKNNNTLSTKLDFEDGYQMPSGYFGPSFINIPSKNLSSYENPLILITDNSLEDINDIRHIAALVDADKRPLVIIADDVSGKALAFCIVNAKNDRPLSVLRAPEYGLERRQMLQDLAIATGAKFIDNGKGDKIQQVKLVDFGSCESFEAGLNHTIFFKSKGEPKKIYERLEQLEAEVKQTKDLSMVKALKIRINQLAGGCAVIKVGGYTDVEIQEKKDRIEDAIEAVKSAKDKGILPGGGYPLYNIALKVLDSNIPGEAVLLRACQGPFRKLLYNHNVMLSPEYHFEKLLEVNKNLPLTEIKSIDFSGNNLEYKCLFELDILDSVKVVETSLKNAISAAGTLLTVGASIVQI